MLWRTSTLWACLVVRATPTPWLWRMMERYVCLVISVEWIIFEHKVLYSSHILPLLFRCIPGGMVTMGSSDLDMLKVVDALSSLSSWRTRTWWKFTVVKISPSHSLKGWNFIPGASNYFDLWRSVTFYLKS